MTKPSVLDFSYPLESILRRSPRQLMFHPGFTTLLLTKGQKHRRRLACGPCVPTVLLRLGRTHTRHQSHIWCTAQTSQTIGLAWMMEEGRLFRSIHHHHIKISWTTHLLKLALQVTSGSRFVMLMGTGHIVSE